MTLQVFHDLYEPCYILSKFKLLNTNTPLVWTLYIAPLVSVLTGFGCISHFGECSPAPQHKKNTFITHKLAAKGGYKKVIEM